MKKLFISFLFVFLTCYVKPQSNDPIIEFDNINSNSPALKHFADLYKEKFAGSRIAYFPDENKTYFVERINIFEDEGQFAFSFYNIKGSVSGILPIALGPIITPGLQFTVQRHKKRKAIKNADGTVDHYVCVYNGFICVILWND